ncbi:MAG: Asp-tRNA(Asn)/Glu-tRNA(Gln) amidotransferase subunit GatC [Pseudomonadota bacterium]
MCDLSQLELTREAQDALAADLRHIVAMIDAMQAVDTSGIEPLAHPLEQATRLRADAVTETVDREAYQRLAPATEAGLYLVPRVVE